MNVRVRYLDRDGAAHDEVKRGPHRRHVPARGRPPRRRPLRRPRARPDARSRTWEQFERYRPRRVRRARSRAFVAAGRLVTDASGASSPGSAASAATPGVVIEVDGERIAAVDAGVARPPAGAERLAGLTLPGLANAHSHAFQRALRGRTHARRRARSGPGASRCTRSPTRLDPDALLRARARDLRRDGARRDHAASASSTTSTTPPTARPYADPNAMGAALIAAAREAGIRITLLDTCYLHGGIGERARRGAAALLRRRRRRAGPSASTRCADGADGADRRRDPQRARGRPRRRAATVAAWAAERERAAARARLRAAGRERGVPRRATARTPTALLADAGALGRALHRGPRHPPDRRRHRRCSATPAHGAASARRPSATSPTGSARPRRSRDAGARARARQRLARGDRPVRGGARGRARRAPRDRRARATTDAAALLARRDRRRATPASAGPTAAASSRARSPTSSPSALDGVRLAGTDRRARARRPSSSPPTAADVAPRDRRRARGRPRRPPRRRSTSPPSCASRSRRCGA